MRKLLRELLKFVSLLILLLLLSLLLPMLLFPPEMDDYQRSYFTKRDLLSSKGDSCIVLLGGSNVAYGFDSRILSDSLNRPVINAAVSVLMGLEFMLDHVSHYMRAGDMLVLCPEYDLFFGDKAYGDDYLIPYYMKDPQVRRDFSIHQYICVLDAWFGFPRVYLHDKFQASAPPPGIRRFFNAYGDHIGHWCESGLEIGLPSRSRFKEINYTFLDYYASSVRSLRSRGVVVVILPPSYALSAYDLVHDRIDSVRVELSMRDVDYMLDPIEFVYPDSLFYDTHYHLGYAGILSRTSRVLTYLRPFVIP